MPESIIKKAKLGLSFKDPFISAVALCCNFVEDKQVKALATNGMDILYNPEFVFKHNKDEIMWCIAHEALHLILGHTYRGKAMSASSETWNKAADMVVNSLLDDQGIGDPLEDSTKCPKEYRGLTTEEIYQKLIVKNPPSPKGNGSGKGNGKGKGNNNNNGNNGNDDNNQDPLSNDIKESADSSTAKELEEKHRSLIEHAKQMGGDNYGGGFAKEMREIIDELFNPKVPWKKLLRNFCSDLVKSDYSWARPNRRYQDMYLPSISGMNPALKNANVYVDVSGSVSDDMVAEFMNEVWYLKKSLNLNDVNICGFSTELSKKTLIKSKKDLPNGFSSTGGTDIEPVINDIIEQNAKINIIFTDGYFDQSPVSMLKQNTFWIIYDNPRYIPSKGKVTHI